MNTTPPHTESAVVFLTNRADQVVMDRLRGIQFQTKDISRCYVLLDASTPSIQKSWASYCREHLLGNIQLVPFIISDLARELSIKLFAPGRIIPGSAHIPLLWLSLKLKHRFYWFVEDDVLFTGDWSSLIGQFDADRTDLLCSHIANYHDVPNWPWWSTLKAPTAAVQSSNPLTLITKGFFPLYRISARALLKILDYQRSGWSGHFEVLIPTILKYAGYSIDDLNHMSPSPLYSAGVIREGEGSGGLSSLRFRPPVSKEELRSSVGGTILHPVKE